MESYGENPFNPGYGVAPPVLAGRGELIHQILMNLQRGPGRGEYHTIVVGPRGTGKTVLLDHVRRHVIDEWGWLDLNWAGRPDWGLAQMLAEQLPGLEPRLVGTLRRAGRSVRPASIEATTPLGGARAEFTRSQPVPARSVTALVEDLGRQAAERRLSVLLVVDELQGASAADLAALSGTLQLVANQRRLPVALLAAGLPHVREVLAATPGTTFIERQDLTVLANLDRDGTLDALEAPFLRAGRDVHPDALDVLWAATGGYPYAIQLAGKHTWDAAADIDVVGVAHARTGAAEAARQLERNLYAGRWDRLSPGEQRYLTAAASLGVERVPTGAIAEALGRTHRQLSPVRDSLIREHHLLTPAGYGHVEFALPGLAAWITAQIAPPPTTGRRGDAAGGRTPGN